MANEATGAQRQGASDMSRWVSLAAHTVPRSTRSHAPPPGSSGPRIPALLDPAGAAPPLDEAATAAAEEEGLKEFVFDESLRRLRGELPYLHATAWLFNKHLT